ncbi:hypothetical protein LQ953_08995 [Sphingomonas sp. IC-56]|nr:hypothetical protein [Sphingomonas sp. IC-56]
MQADDDNSRFSGIRSGKYPRERIADGHDDLGRDGVNLTNGPRGLLEQRGMVSHAPSSRVQRLPFDLAPAHQKD